MRLPVYLSAADGANSTCLLLPAQSPQHQQHCKCHADLKTVITLAKRKSPPSRKLQYTAVGLLWVVLPGAT